jgi:hypothetical protein
MCDFDGLDWMDIALAGALAEQMAKEQKELEQLRREMEPENDEKDSDSD